MFLTTNLAYAHKNLDGNSKSAPVSDESASVTLGASSLGYYVSPEFRLNNPSINGVAYDGDFTFKVREKNDLVPLVSFGYHGTIFGGWSLSTELGARTSNLILTTTGQENLTGPVLGTLRPQFDAEVEAFNRDLGEINLLPFFTIGINYRF